MNWFARHRHRLIDIAIANLRLVVSIVRKYTNRGLQFLDLLPRELCRSTFA